MGLFSFRTDELVAPDRALRGRAEPIIVAKANVVLGTTMTPPFPDGIDVATFAMGCFWGAERRFFTTEGVYSTAVGYCGGYTPNPTYEEVCSGRTGHAEAILVAFDPEKIAYGALVASFFEGHDPTQHMRQGNDFGTQYRSAIFAHNESQRHIAEATRDRYREAVLRAGFKTIATGITDAGPFYYAEDYHQQYLAKNPAGYCGLGGTGVACPVGIIEV